MRNNSGGNAPLRFHKKPSKEERSSLQYEGELSTTEESRRSHLIGAETPGPTVQLLERERLVSSFATPSGMVYSLITAILLWSSQKTDGTFELMAIIEQ